MCRGDDTNNLHILIDLGFRTENQVQLPFMSPVPVVSALVHMKKTSVPLSYSEDFSKEGLRGSRQDLFYSYVLTFLELSLLSKLR